VSALAAILSRPGWQVTVEAGNYADRTVVQILATRRPIDERMARGEFRRIGRTHVGAPTESAADLLAEIAPAVLAQMQQEEAGADEARVN
jgi:hypothetical protein